MKNLKVKIDEYFGVKGCIESQLWFYGLFGFGGIVMAICVMSQIQLLILK